MVKGQSALRAEWRLGITVLTMLLFLLFGKPWLADFSNVWWLVLMSAWLFGAMMISAFGVVRHAETLADKLGEPLGTLILTLAPFTTFSRSISATAAAAAPSRAW